MSAHERCQAVQSIGQATVPTGIGFNEDSWDGKLKGVLLKDARLMMMLELERHQQDPSWLNLHSDKS